MNCITNNELIGYHYDYVEEINKLYLINLINLIK